MDSKSLGKFGEAQAAKYLRRRLYSIVAVNYSCRFGEIDIIAKKGGYIVFVEVKLRKDAGFAQAREFVTRAKQERILNTAAKWLSENESALQPRFDVIEVYAPEGERGRVKIEHIENAFE